MSLNFVVKIVVSPMLIASLVVGGCAPNRVQFSTSAESQSQQQLRTGANELAVVADEVEGCTGNEVMWGALLGAALGAAAGYGAARATNTNPYAGMAAGGALGAGGGYAAGSYVHDENCSYSNAQAALQARTAEANKETSRYMMTLASAQAVVRERRSQIADLNAQYRQKLITSAVYDTRIRGVKDDLVAMRSLVNSNRKSVTSFDTDIIKLKSNGQNTSGLETARNRLTQQGVAMQTELDNFTAVVGEIPPGATTLGF